jgi:putative membrane protein insertion efficiency factor
VSQRAFSGPSRFAVRFIETYREDVAPRRAHRCRFEPSCSSYGLEAYRTYGFARATAKTTWRILRCNPLNRRGVRSDPP